MLTDSRKGTNHHQSSSRCRQLRGVGGWMPAVLVELAEDSGLRPEVFQSHSQVALRRCLNV